MKKTILIASLLLGFVGAVSAQTMSSSPALYQAFGEKAGLVKLMDDFVPRLQADPRLAEAFKKSECRKFEIAIGQSNLPSVWRSVRVQRARHESGTQQYGHHQNRLQCFGRSAATVYGCAGHCFQQPKPVTCQVGAYAQRRDYG